MVQTMEIGCPKCGSTQLTANKKGFSGAKAVGGALLTGGIGLLAGTIGSSNVIITCLACGKKFKPGKGKKVIINNQSPYSSTITPSIEGNRIVCSECQTENFTNHKYCKNCKRELSDEDKRITSTEIVRLRACPNCKNLTPNEGKFCPHCGIVNEPPKSGCFIATACYGDYNAPEVLVLRRYRDEKLLKTHTGKCFVKLYYIISPFFASFIRKSGTLKQLIRHYLLESIVHKLNTKMKQ